MISSHLWNALHTKEGLKHRVRHQLFLILPDYEDGGKFLSATEIKRLRMPLFRYEKTIQCVDRFFCPGTFG